MTPSPDSPGPPWTIIRLLDWTRQHFASKGIEDARLEAELLLAHALGLERVQLYVEHGRVVEEPQLGAFRELVRRRAQHEPTQYLLGQAWFRNLTLKVTPAVLIPRPETELLVDEALELIAPHRKPAWKFERGEFHDYREESGAETGELIETGRPQPPREPRALDLGTGSGCIAIALAVECPQARVVATDISPEALAVARENVSACGVADRVTLLEGDLFDALLNLAETHPQPRPPAAAALAGGTRQERVREFPEELKFDLITANPPYVAEAELAGLMPEVRDWEPRAALVAGPTGFEVIDRLLAEAPAYLKPHAALLMEIAFNQSAAMRQRIARRQAGTGPDGSAWEQVRIRKDLGGHERVVHLRRL